MEQNCRSRHMTLWRSLKAPSPLRAQGSAMAPVTLSPGPSSLSARSETWAGCQNPAATQRPTQTRIHAQEPKQRSRSSVNEYENSGVGV